MSEDRELLELAAKALGKWDKQFDCYIGSPEWNPLEKTTRGKADCLQMEIDLKLDADFDYDKQEWDIYGKSPVSGILMLLATNTDRKLASTMAAAEIGKLL